MKQLGRAFRILKALVRLRFQHLMMFRIGFWGPFFVDGSLFTVQLLAYKAIYSNVEKIGNWGEGEMILFIGTFSLINAVNMAIYFFGVNSISDKIKSGDMDLYITKPVSSLFYISMERINPGALPLIAMSFIIIIHGIHISGIDLDAGKILAYTFWVIIMILLYYDMEVILRSISFYFIPVDQIERLEDSGLELCMQLPGIAFYGVYKVIFCVILPYGIMATIPVQSLVGEMTPVIVLHGGLIVCTFTGLMGIIWKSGLRHYNSASS